MRPLVLVASVLAALATAACGGGSAPAPQVAQAPIEATQAPADAPPPTVEEAPPPHLASGPQPVPASGPAPLGGPQPIAATGGTVGTSTGGTSGAPAAAPDKASGKGPLTPAECDKLIRRFAELVAQGQGGMLKSGWESNPLVGSMRDSCQKDNTRAQYDCAMKAKSHTEWMDCLR